jgi:FlaA1/EpsC-like NDP-sugar epimerase
MFQNKILLITRGIGFSGSTILNRILKPYIIEICIFSRDGKDKMVKKKFKKAKDFIWRKATNNMIKIFNAG